MKITTSKLRDSIKALQQLSETRLPAPAALRVALALRSLQGPIEAFDATWNALLKDCGTTVAEGSFRYKIKEEHQERFTKEAKALLEQELEIAVEPIPLELFGSAEITPAMLLTLDWLIPS